MATIDGRQAQRRLVPGLEKPAHRDFKIPPLTPQTISRVKYNPSLMRFHFLEVMVRQHRWHTGVELGCLAGRTTGHLMRSCPSLRLVAVDLFAPQPDNPGPEGWEHHPHEKHEAQLRAMEKGFAPRLKVVKDLTVNAAQRYADNSIDFIFIDADHSYEGCRADIEAWLPKVKPAGFLFGHDINWPGVLRACEELMPGYEIGPNVVWFRPKDPAAFNPTDPERWADRYKY